VLCWLAYRPCDSLAHLSFCLWLVLACLSHACAGLLACHSCAGSLAILYWLACHSCVVLACLLVSCLCCFSLLVMLSEACVDCHSLLVGSNTSTFFNFYVVSFQVLEILIPLTSIILRR